MSDLLCALFLMRQTSFTKLDIICGNFEKVFIRFWAQRSLHVHYHRPRVEYILFVVHTDSVGDRVTILLSYIYLFCVCFFFFLR